jgi:hypothetical protein
MPGWSWHAPDEAEEAVLEAVKIIRREGGELA